MLGNAARREQPDPLTIEEIARRAGAPKRFLEQIRLDIRKTGIVGSIRGRAGGPVLIEPPAEVSICGLLRLIAVAGLDLAVLVPAPLSGVVAEALKEGWSAALANPEAGSAIRLTRRVTAIEVPAKVVSGLAAAAALTLGASGWRTFRTVTLGNVRWAFLYGALLRTARALAIEPRMLLLDEPFGALDAKVREELRQVLRDIHDETRLTTIFVTHDQDEAMELADLVVVMSMGRIEKIGTPQEIRARPAPPVVREFIMG